MAEPYDNLQGLMRLSQAGPARLRRIAASHHALAVSVPVKAPEFFQQCNLSITLMTLLPAVWTFYSMRKYASTHYHLAGSVASLSAFSVGALWLRLHEADDSIAHVVEWYYLQMLGIGLLGLWLGKAFLKW